MQALARARAAPASNLHILDLPYRLCSWGLDDPQQVCLWEDAASGELTAWAILQSPFWALDYAIHPAAERELHLRILTWGDQCARAIAANPGGHPTWFVNVFARQHDRLADLNAAGYSDQGDMGEDSWSKALLARPLDQLEEAVELPAGFTIRPLAGLGEVNAYVDLHREAFGTNNMTHAWRERILHHPAYQPELDLVAVTSDGQLAAFCVGWFDPQGEDGTPAGRIEPLGVGPDFRRLGLGRAILSETFRRFRLLGARQVYVESDQQGAAFAFYQRVGFRVIDQVKVFRKDIHPL